MKPRRNGTGSVIARAIAVWFILLMIAVLNGSFRDKVLVPWVGTKTALPLSGFLLSLLIFMATLVFIPLVGKTKSRIYFGIGLIWFFLTLAFEFLFGHYVIGKSWYEILQVFDLNNGNLFLLVLIVCAVSPWVSGKLRGYF